MTEFIKDLGQCLNAVFWHWQSWFGGSGVGGAVVGFVYLYERLTGTSVDKRMYILIFVVVFLVCAFFLAWRDEHKKVKNSAAYLEGRIINPFYKENMFPPDKPGRVSLVWINRGAGPAFDAEPYTKMYIVSDTPPGASTEENTKVQEDVIRQWKADYALRTKLLREVPPFWPNTQRTVNAIGPVITPALAEEIMVKKTKIVFVVGAIIFRDSVGKHEAHSCAWLNNIEPDGTNPHWTECIDYVSQIDLDN